MKDPVDAKNAAAAKDAKNPPKYLRLKVTELDPATRMLTGVDTDSESVEKQVYSFCYSTGKDAFANLHEVVRVGDIVCAVTPTFASNPPKASEIVLEPDYLISPQSLGRASVWKRGEIYYWLDKIKDAPEEKYRHSGSGMLKKIDYRLLGDFANACLAEMAANRASDAKALQRDFCKANPVDFTDADPDRKWFDDGSNIHENLRRRFYEQGLPFPVPQRLDRGRVPHAAEFPESGRVPADRWQIEAPLYSNVHGLSARADAVAYNRKKNCAAIFELKSGKWDNFNGDHSRIEHRIQANYYSDLLYFTAAGIRRDHVNSFLYYAATIAPSQYYSGSSGMLFSESGTQDSIQRHADFRNRVLAAARKIREGSFRTEVDTLIPEDFRSPETGGGKLWENFKRPEIASLLAPFQKAAPLEKLYFYRLLKFLADEDCAQHLGEANADIGRGGTLALWRLPLNARREAGLRLSALRVIGMERDALSRVASLTLDTSKDELNKNCSIRAGDSVCLYREDEKDANINITTAIVFAASATAIDSHKIELKLDNAQSEALFDFSESARFAVEPAPSGSNASGYHALWHFLAGNARRRALALNATEPEIDASAELPAPLAPETEQRHPGLSELLLRVWQAKDWHLIWGPPGTGKTTQAMRALVDQAMAAPEMNVLLLSYTYKAGDEICKMLEARLRSGATEKYIRFGNPLKCAPALRGRIIEELGLENRQAVKNIVGKTRIVVGTILTLTPGHALFGMQIEPGRRKHFELAIIDEASQLLDTHMLALFCAKDLDSADNGRPLIDKFVFIGDDKQLPAVVQQSPKTSRVSEPELNERGIIDCRQSFFERLRRIADGGGNGNEPDPKLCSTLKTQFRMHPLIADFVNVTFYGNILKHGNSKHQTSELPPLPPLPPPRKMTRFERYVMTTRLGFFSVEPDGHAVDSKVNSAEAEVCAKIIHALISHPSRPTGDNDSEPAPRPYRAEEIGVIVPFRNQIAAIRARLSERFGAADVEKIVIDTVERYQGGQRDVILFSTVIKNASQSGMLSARRLDEEDDDGDIESCRSIDRKLNVAITRARERFYLIGCEPVLRSLRAYGDFVAWVKEKNPMESCES